MRVLLFEWLNGGGRWVDNDVPNLSCPFQIQGLAMLTAVAEDFGEIGIRIVVPFDSRLSLKIPGTQNVPVASPEELPLVLQQQAELCDAILLIAPEIGGRLENCCRWVEPFASKLVSPDLEFVSLASDKQRTMDCLVEGGISVPIGGPLPELGPIKTLVGLPAVAKPNDGAGSEQVRLIRDWTELETLNCPGYWRVERFVPGTPVSVSVLCGKRGCKTLPPTGQSFDRQPFGTYVGAIFPLEKSVADRATRLASQTMDALPATNGYIGIDMVIPESTANNSVVIEINPRITMSYIQLRQILGSGLVSEMLKIGATR